MTTDPHEHWLDQLAEAHTRRQLLKRILVGAALTLPLARSTDAFGAARAGLRAVGCNAGKGKGAHDCSLGCQTTAANHLDSANSDCVSKALAAGGAAGGAVGVVVGSVLGVFLGPLGVAGGAAYGTYKTSDKIYDQTYQPCLDRILTTAKAAFWDCQQPNCPGWDPCDPLGPCTDCTRAGVTCCPSTASPTGYTCCNCCADNGDGCKAICS